VTAGQPAYQPDPKRPNPFALTALASRADAANVGSNRFCVIDVTKHSSVIVLRLDSATRAG
jgi:hypothetical protein